MTKLIFAPEDEAGLGEIGGKALALGQMMAHGFEVPDFCVVIPAAFDEDGLLPKVQEDLQRWLKEVGPGPYAVRSSAREEDGVSHSHAGQFLSLLNVRADEIAEAAEKVWRSGAIENVAKYRQIQGLDTDGGAPAVIIQQMVPARVAGIIFTADPVSGRRDRIIVSATRGLADELVGGATDGSSYVLDKNTGKVLEADSDDILSSDDLNTLTNASLEIEQLFGLPQDIEWAFDRNELKLLQSRPITSKLRAAPLQDETLTLFDNSNIVESYPGLVTPLTYSFAQYVYARVYRMFVGILGVRREVIRDNAQVFDNMLARIDGRVYYNLINWYRALAMLPGFSINRAHMETMMGVSEALPDEVADEIAEKKLHGIALWREWLRVGRVGLKLGFEAVRMRSTIGGFEKRLQNTLAKPASDMQQMPLSALAIEYRRIEADLLDRWDAPLINDFLCMMAFGASRKMMEKWVGPRGIEFHNDFMIGQGDIISAEPARWITRMGKMAKGEEELMAGLAAGDDSVLELNEDLKHEISAYIEKFGDRCTEELKLESITLDEDPAPLLMSIEAAANNPAIGDAKTRKHISLDEVFPRNPVKKRLAGWTMKWARTRVRDRENLRFERTRIFGRARALFLAVGQQFHALGVLDESRDIFFLTVDEILGAIEGFGVSYNLKQLAELRKSEQSMMAKCQDPAERLEVRGAAISGLSSASELSTSEHMDGIERKGTGCSAGVIRARARVVRDPRTQHLECGEILVARYTDPGWIALFTNASAIVVERGSLLSHSAIVARELGIPCVVGLKGAMEWIENGEMIEVDGASGIVRKKA